MINLNDEKNKKDNKEEEKETLLIEDSTLSAFGLDPFGSDIQK